MTDFLGMQIKKGSQHLIAKQFQSYIVNLMSHCYVVIKITIVNLHGNVDYLMVLSKVLIHSLRFRIFQYSFLDY